MPLQNHHFLGISPVRPLLLCPRDLHIKGYLFTTTPGEELSYAMLSESLATYQTSALGGSPTIDVTMAVKLYVEVVEVRFIAVWLLKLATNKRLGRR